MLKTRLWMGTTLVVLLSGGLWIDEWLRGESVAPHVPKWLPPYPCWLAFALIVVIGCCRELRQLMRHRGIRAGRWTSYGTVIGVTLANWVPWFTASNQAQDHLAWAFAAVCVANMLIVTREAIMFREPGSAVVTAGGGMLLVFYLGVLATFLIELRWLEHGLVALAAHVAAAKCGDIGAYFGGRALGRNKLWPILSPKKTTEGSVCGLAASVVGTLAVVWGIAMLTGTDPVLTKWVCVLFGLTVGGLAQFGDLIESLIKRDCQQKDASDLVPGFGGVLDVLDSPLFSAPLAFLWWIWLGPGWGPGL
jgi:phosphatidate cytidylyltransferase